ncbi:hypothetical protein BDY19DRAFT_441045 [Irpex rosettiformis]|uniref:Uncharacterized protein n=1 Tax=Irpex rosettiformis TaxID=378272 RepID=A0ACB8TU11_9APHY|nr:hypothetical protein BDY19DRAFT_441045 [Irpex rosettiformis]
MSGQLPPDVPVSKDTLLLLAPVYAGALISFLLFGISVMQLCTLKVDSCIYRNADYSSVADNYSLYYTRDSWPIKITVYGVFLLDIFQSLTFAVLGYYSLVSGWGRPLALLQLNWTFSAVPLITGVVAAWVQTFYAWRIYKIGEWRYLPAFIIAIALMQCAAAISITVGIPSLPDVLALHILYRRTIVWLGGAAAADVIIAIAMLYLLFTVRRSKFERTKRVINRLIKLTVETGVITATSALLELIMFQVLPNTNMHIFFAAMLAKVYSNALMTSLNSRTISDRARADLEPGGAASQQYSQYSSYSNPPGRRTMERQDPLRSFTTTGAVTNGPPTVVHISTDREVEYNYDEDDMKSNVVLGPPSDTFPMTRMSNTTAVGSELSKSLGSPRYLAN